MGVTWGQQALLPFLATPVFLCVYVGRGEDHTGQRGHFQAKGPESSKETAFGAKRPPTKTG